MGGFTLSDPHWDFRHPESLELLRRIVDKQGVGLTGDDLLSVFNGYLPAGTAAECCAYLHALFQLFRTQSLRLACVLSPCRKIQHTGRIGLLGHHAPQSEEIQEHLQSQSMVNFRIVKALFAGFVVHHPQVALALMDPLVHTIHKTGQAQLHTVGHLHGRQLLAPAKAQFKPGRGEIGHRQLGYHAVHYRGGSALHAVKEVAESGRGLL
jgi:hypothetical protein